MQLRVAIKEEKRGLVTKRLAKRRARQNDTAAVTSARDSYKNMYKEFCASGGPAEPTVCEKWGEGAAERQSASR